MTPPPAPGPGPRLPPQPWLGLSLVGEEHPPTALLEQARAAEEAGFGFLLVSDHYHPWSEAQGHSPFLWTLLGGLAAVTRRIPVGTGVTCPAGRIHPAVVAQAAATTACLLEGRFFLGVGTGEALNEHILGDPWPPYPERLARLEEALTVIRRLWSGEELSWRGPRFRVDRARIYDLPSTPPPVLMAASGTRAARAAARLAEGLISLGPDASVCAAYREAGGAGPRLTQLSACWAPSLIEARRTAHRLWPVCALEGQAYARLETPAALERATASIPEEEVAAAIPCGPDPATHLEAIRDCLEAGFSHVSVHLIGPRWREGLELYAREILPRLPSLKGPGEGPAQAPLCAEGTPRP